MPKQPTTRQARNASGEPVHPGSGVFPILKELHRGRLKVVGTGFFISRYGLFITAAHVVQDLVGDEGLGVAYVFHVPEPYQGLLHLRQIKRVTLFNEIDLAIGQADNFVKKYPQNPLGNLRCTLTEKAPNPGDQVFTYAYPENEELLFDGSNTPRIMGDCFEGKFLSVASSVENPFIPYVHYLTSIRVRSGASGGPVFEESGNIIGVNCRGWDFDGAEHQGDELSSVVPIRYILDMAISPLQLPASSWEYRQLPDSKVDTSYTVRQLIEYGHVVFGYAA